MHTCLKSAAKTNRATSGLGFPKGICVPVLKSVSKTEAGALNAILSSLKEESEAAKAGSVLPSHTLVS